MTSAETTVVGQWNTDMAELAAQLRVDSIRAGSSVGSGHVTSSLSAADLMAVLLQDHLCYDWQHPDNPDNDHLIFSKGHASPLLYSMFRAAGVLEDGELVRTYRRLHARLEGHPTPRLPWVEVATGSLGQGLPIGAGMALAARKLTGRGGHVWVLCGDSEMTEGSVWEALDLAGRSCLDNLTVIIDVNRLGQSGPTSLQWDVDAYVRRARAFGLATEVVDGHDLAAIDAAYRRALENDVPTAIVAKTVKGRGVPEIEDLEGWHGKALPDDMASRAIDGLGGQRDLRIDGHPPRTPAWQSATRPGGMPDGAPELDGAVAGSIELPSYELGAEIETRTAYGDALAALGARGDIVALDGEVGNSTRAQTFAKAHPDKYFEMFIAESQMVATAVAMDKAGYRPFAATFAAFISRAYDFIRMAAISQANIVLCGSHAGSEIGADGPSQMALEDIASLRAVHGSTVLYPADAPSCAHLVAHAADQGGIVYVRTTRGGYPVLYEPDETFPIGGCKVHRGGENRDVTVIAAGVTVHEALDAARRLADGGIAVQVIDAYSIKPLDVSTIAAAIAETDGRVIVVEDHHPEGGLCSAVLEGLAEPGRPINLTLESLAVRIMPGSATPAEQLAEAEIDADAIVAAAQRLMT